VARALHHARGFSLDVGTEARGAEAGVGSIRQLGIVVIVKAIPALDRVALGL